jgi:4-hydroxy-tetrahydrodipicolinate synthase
LVVTPYYSRPQQEGLLAHFAAVADATDLPIMLYDIPPRSVVAIAPETLLRLAEHPRITAVKDAKGDLLAGSQVIAGSDLAYYSGDDPLTLPWMSVGGVGIVSIISHVVGPHVRAMVDAAEAGDYVKARKLHLDLLPAHRAMGRCGFGVGDPRLPQIPATKTQTEQIARDLDEIGPLL